MARKTNELTLELRAALRARGIAYTEGYCLPHGVRVDRDTVTTAWPVEGDALASVTYEEEDGALWCMDSVSVPQAIGAALGVTL